jgi:hypothetical protein
MSTYTDLVCQAIAAGREVGACPNSDCAGDMWTIERRPGYADEWRVADLGSPDACLVRGATPTCPWCGQGLLILPYHRLIQQPDGKGETLRSTAHGSGTGL